MRAPRLPFGLSSLTKPALTSFCRSSSSFLKRAYSLGSDPGGGDFSYAYEPLPTTSSSIRPTHPVAVLSPSEPNIRSSSFWYAFLAAAIAYCFSSHACFNDRRSAERSVTEDAKMFGVVDMVNVDFDVSMPCCSVSNFA